MKCRCRYSNSSFMSAVEEHIHSERDRNILIDRFTNGLSVSELSDKYNLCDRQVSRIICSAEDIFNLIATGHF